jgi:hypothetical protein
MGCTMNPEGRNSGSFFPKRVSTVRITVGVRHWNSYRDVVLSRFA